MSAVVMGASFGWTVRNVQSRGQTGPSLSLSLALAIRAPRLLMVQDLPKRCPQCFSELVPCDIRLRIGGHGSATDPALRVRLESPGAVPLDTFVAAESLEVSRG